MFISLFIDSVGNTVKPVELVTCHSWPHFYGTRNSVWYYAWSLLHKLVTCLSWILATASHL